ncbi:hypothetical protein VHUM_02983 [Vanrija humicola]|uniref:RING-type E3 ubiquitin transferase n=1 Tax=Vanrija humicola TaxID=5417 RepID=A0A7D8UYT8_VANHU|nr:hypothetical protein VHUM_02983 [Vanrija humicola]
MSRPAAVRQQSSPPGSPSGRNNHLSVVASNQGFASPTSPRSTFLGSFMRTRSRAASVTNAVAGAVRGRVGSPTTEQPNPLGNNDVTRSVSSTPASTEPAAPVNIPPVDPALRRTHRVRLVPVLETNRSFSFAPVVRELGVMHVPPGILPSIAAASVTDVGPKVNGRAPPLIIKIGRFTDKAAGSTAPVTAPAPAPAAADASTPGGGPSSAASASANGAGSAPGATATTAAPAAPPPAASAGGGGGDILAPKAAFKSKVVSRAHAEIWCEPGGKFYIRDTASSSGTFLNHIRLSSPNVQSRPQLLKDGDVVQLGVDYQGGAEEMYRCVKMRVEIGREWQRGANEFNTNALKQLKALGGGEEKGDKAEVKAAASGSSGKKKASVTDCCICLFSVTVCQSLFIAPCSHVFHYKCIRPLLNQHYPGFSCPLCRTFANLEEDVETEDAWEIASRRASVISRRNSNHSIRLPPAPDGAAPHPPTTEGEPSTGVGFGDASASIDDLLAGSSDRSSQDVATPAVEDADSRPALQRQTTAVGESTQRNSAAPSNIASLQQTPMNDYFLSSLANNHSGLATPSRDDASSGPGSRRSHEVVEEEPAAEAAAEAEAAEANGSDSDGMHMDP